MRRELTVEEVLTATSWLPDPPPEMLKRAGLTATPPFAELAKYGIRCTAFLDDGWSFGYEDALEQVEHDWHPFPEAEDGVDYWLSDKVLEAAGFEVV